MTQPDLLDYAADLAEQQRADALAAHAARAAREPARGATDCVDCGDPIPPARRAAVPGAVRCVLCQQLHEDHVLGGLA